MKLLSVKKQQLLDMNEPVTESLTEGNDHSGAEQGLTSCQEHPTTETSGESQSNEMGRRDNYVPPDGGCWVIMFFSRKQLAQLKCLSYFQRLKKQIQITVILKNKERIEI